MSATTPGPGNVAPGGGSGVPAVVAAAAPAFAAPAGAGAGPDPEPGPAQPTLAQERIADLIRHQGGRSDGLIEVLHQVQEIHGYLPRSALLQVAWGLRLPLSRVYGVASFYHLFRLQPPADHRCAVCLGTACFVRGGGRLAAGLQRRLGLALDQTSGDGQWALEQVSCLGACGQAPVMVFDGALFTAPLSGPLPGPSTEATEGLDRWLSQLGLPDRRRPA
ncbi:MAG: NAD(P)H-dependent oxidoreductase subunit E [Cyanobium sp.]